MIHELARAVLSAQPPAGAKPVAPAGRAGAPSNQQIIDASQAAYSAGQPAVDALALALANLINTGSQRAAITTLDGTNWTSPGIGPGLTDGLFACSDLQGAKHAARTVPALNSLSVGVFTGHLPGGGSGMVGFARDLAGTSACGLQLKLDIFSQVVSTDVGSNLQLGVWAGAAGALHDEVIGLYATVPVNGVSVNLKILLSLALQTYGFVVSTGATVNLPVGAAVFAGSTAGW